MALEEIERLKEKISKDPNSKLFVPLAEEFKKNGMFEEAIEVLTQGLERQPNYLSARVSLGKIYIERNMLAEAKSEFEQVTSAIPDNLYAHKKLAEIYRDLGEHQNAIKEFKTVLRLNPMDEWAAAGLSTVEHGPETVPQTPEPQQVTDVLPSETPPMAMAEGVDLSQESPDIIPLQDMHAEAEPAAIEEEEDLWMQHSDTLKELDKVQEQRSGDLLQSDAKGLWEAAPEIPQEEQDEGVSISKEDLALWKSHAETIETADHIEEVAEAEALPEDEALSFEGLGEIQKTAAPAHTIPAAPAPGIVDAENFIAQGKYNEAMNVYKKLLSQDPGNNRVMQRIEELRTLLKLLGKDKEELIITLEHFLDAIKKRRNELSGRA